jgi:hypothetical protein
MAIEIKLKNEDWAAAGTVEQDIAAYVRGQFCRYPPNVYQPGPPLKVIISVLEDEKAFPKSTLDPEEAHTIFFGPGGPGKSVYTKQFQAICDAAVKKYILDKE